MSARSRQVPYEGETNVSPWEAILKEVRRSAYRASWVDERVEAESEAERILAGRESEIDDHEKFKRLQLAQSRELREWVRLSREERAHGAQVARAAVSAGLSEKYISSVQAEAKMIAQTLQRALQAANLTDEQWEAATTELRVALADVGRELKTRHDSVGSHIAVRSELES